MESKSEHRKQHGFVRDMVTLKSTYKSMRKNIRRGTLKWTAGGVANTAFMKRSFAILKIRENHAPYFLCTETFHHVTDIMGI